MACACGALRVALGQPGVRQCACLRHQVKGASLELGGRTWARTRHVWMRWWSSRRGDRGSTHNDTRTHNTHAHTPDTSTAAAPASPWGLARRCGWPTPRRGGPSPGAEGGACMGRWGGAHTVAQWHSRQGSQVTCKTCRARKGSPCKTGAHTEAAARVYHAVNAVHSMIL